MQKKHFSLSANPARVIAGSFLGVIITGTLLLMLPLSAKNGAVTNFFDALFTATSATCVTGLIVVDTYTHWTFFGQGVILSLIQIGGLGLVTLTLFFNLLIRRKLGLRTLQLAQESTSASNFEDTPRLLRGIVGISLTVEAIGAVLLLPAFVPKYGMEGIFISVFTSVSAFCNAGFDLLGREGPYSSLIHYNGSYVLLVVSALIIIGGLGFMVLFDLLHYHKSKKLRLHSRVVLLSTACLLFIGTLGFAALEWHNPATMGNLPVWQKLNAAFFQSVSTRTAGFNSIDIASMNEISKVLSIGLMFIGAAPGSTGGGIKVTTIVVLIMTAVSVARGYDDTIIMKHKIKRQVVNKSLTVVFIGFLAVLLASGVIIYTTHDGGVTASTVDALFESTSAFATVGLSSGITAIANLPSKLLLIATMFLGRIGPISFLLSLAAGSGKVNRKQVMPEGHLNVG
ncbi:MAG: potassium transporter TrkG [Oscillospiraceae bacterium]|mgnify:FL=1|jgi:trk system potassium uptake protein TrkH|nr:potassium transporter Trk [Oscillospiraceae bacterium]MDD7040611.1 potassium transporter TrkG [Oscillospiraceae bacterium]MDY2612009.1 potassium transporter TrkG [Oscillospiraceae bacterium]